MPRKILQQFVRMNASASLRALENPLNVPSAIYGKITYLTPSTFLSINLSPLCKNEALTVSYGEEGGLEVEPAGWCGDQTDVHAALVGLHARQYQL